MRPNLRYFPLIVAVAISPVRGADAEAAQQSPVPSRDSAAVVSELERNTKAIQQLTLQVEELTKALKSHVTESAAARGPQTKPVESPAPQASGTSSPIPVLPALPAQNRHTVQKGETLTSIAKHYGVTIEEISKANNIQDARKLQVGQELIIPPAPAQPEPKEQ